MSPLAGRQDRQPANHGKGCRARRHTVSLVPPRSELAEPVKGGNTATNKHTGRILASYIGTAKVDHPRG